MQSRYELIDPVIARALRTAEPFKWGPEIASDQTSPAQKQLLDEAAQFGIGVGFTVQFTMVAALLGCHDIRDPRSKFIFSRIVFRSRLVFYQLMAMYFHAHVRRALKSEPALGGVRLSPREFECLEWAAPW